MRSSSAIGIVIATRDRRERLLATLARVTALQERPPVLVADNGSTDGTPQAVRTAFPGVRLRALGRNRGTGARNEGVAHLTTRYVALLDDDSWWAPGALARAVALLDRHPRVAVLAAKVLVGEDERLDPACAAMAVSPLAPALDGVGPEVLGFVACGAVLRRDAFLAVGGFDERYGIGGEETRLAVKLAAAGWELRYAPDVVAHHHPSPSRTRAGRTARVLRNDLWTTWSARPAGEALRASARLLRASGWRRETLSAALSALRGARWVARQRRHVGPAVAARLRALERHGADAADNRPGAAYSASRDGSCCSPRAAGREVTLDVLLDFVKRTRGFDFTGYKRSTIERRVDKRMAEVGVGSVRVMAADRANGVPDGVADALRDSAYDAAPGAQVVVDRDGVLVLATDGACRLLGLSAKDVGRPVADLDLSYRPLELRARLERTIQDRQPIVVEAVRWRSPAGQDRVVDVRMAPVLWEGEVLGTAIAYHDGTELFRLQSELTESRRDLAQAHAELRLTVEELETTNEELQSTNEELETTNEELETMNDELQSTNEELETMNDELRRRTFELNGVNAFLETILTTIGLAVAVLDRRQHVQLWNGQARELWGLAPDEVDGQHLLSLDIGLPVERLEPMLRACLNGAMDRQQLTVDAVNRRGKPIRCVVSCLPLSSFDEGEASGIILMMEPVAP